MNAPRLDDTHVLVVTHDDEVASASIKALEAQGTIVHRAHNQHEAIGTYWKLFKDGYIPRLILSSFWMVTANERKALTAIGRKADATCLHMIENVRAMDPDNLIVVYTGDAKQATKQIANCGFDDSHIEVHDRKRLSPEELVDYLMNHKNIQEQRDRKTCNSLDTPSATVTQSVTDVDMYFDSNPECF